MLHQLLFQQGSGDQKCASPLRLSQQLDLLFTQKSWQESIAKENYYLMSEFLSFNGYSLKLLDSINSMRCHTLVLDVYQKMASDRHFCTEMILATICLRINCIKVMFYFEEWPFFQRKFTFAIDVQSPTAKVIGLSNQNIAAVVKKCNFSFYYLYKFILLASNLWIKNHFEGIRFFWFPKFSPFM